MEEDLSVLRFYRVHPDRANVRVISQLLVKASVSGNRSAYLPLVSDRWRREPEVSILIRLSEALDAARLDAFWESYVPSRGEIESIAPRVESAARKQALDMVSATYQSVPVSRLGAMLNLEGDALADFVDRLEEDGWKLDSRGNVHPPANPSNHPRPSRGADTVPFVQVRALV